MKIIVSHKLDRAAINKLKEMGEVVVLDDQSGVYVSIASHPDIYFCQHNDLLFVAPSLANDNRLQSHTLNIRYGVSTPIGNYPETACYNAVFSGNVFIHNLKVSDKSLLAAAEPMQKVHVNQAYTRCNLVGLDGKRFITSDQGIETTLLKSGFEVFYIDAKQVQLEGHQHGFFGGACGVYQKTIYLCGSLNSMKEADGFKRFTQSCGYVCEELHSGPLKDVGSIIFVNDNC